MINFPTNEAIPLPPQGSWPESVHRFDTRSANALNAALAAQRPLLVRGNPGTGKSQLARAAAQYLNRLFVTEVVHAKAESHDLQYHFDAVGRLGEAQALGAACRTGEEREKEVRECLEPKRFLAPGALWWIFNWETAWKQSAFTRFKHRKPEKPPGWEPAKGSVLLIDEIDKADADLPNGLLETLGNGGFTVPYCDDPVRVQEGMKKPLVIITTNEERELPDAFVRRCLVLHLYLPDEDPKNREQPEGVRQQALTDYLMQRGKDHFSDLADEVLQEAAVQLWADRNDARRQGLTPPGMAEYIDLLRAVRELGSNAKEQLSLLGDIKEFVLKKHLELL
ncbi:MAG: AAA family ATPase [Candidatus Electrothrix sp. AR5]|nr:AAA family ATPase [Candidatus Electrothrix sp. AR5]